MYGGSGVSPCRLAVEPEAPAALAEVLEQLDRAVAARPASSRRVGRASASQTSPSSALEQQHLAARRRRSGSAPGTTRVSLTTTSSPSQLVRQLGEARGAGPSPVARS